MAGLGNGGRARQGTAGTAWKDVAGMDVARYGWAGTERNGPTRTGLTRRGRQGLAWKGAAGRGAAWLGRHGVERRGWARLGWARQAGGYRPLPFASAARRAANSAAPDRQSGLASNLSCAACTRSVGAGGGA